MGTFLKAVVTLYCEDIAAAAQFYGTLLGLTETYRFARDGVPEHIEYQVGSTTIAISSPNGLVSHGMPAATPGHPFEIGLKTDDVDALVAQLSAAGVTILKPPFDSAAGNRVCYIADPQGTWIALYHNLERPDGR